METLLLSLVAVYGLLIAAMIGFVVIVILSILGFFPDQ